MRDMSTQAKHLPQSPKQAEFTGQSACCLAAESLSGDCRLGFAERFRMIETECRFGLACGRGCHQAQRSTLGFAGHAAVLAGVVGPIEAASNERDLKEP
ncbi:MAG: hypothetical protein RL322_3040 [Pseudomonadota bacterium]